MTERTEIAVGLIGQYAGTGGAHHKQWLLDQVLRALLGDAYENWIVEWEDHGQYEWDEGIAP